MVYWFGVKYDNKKLDLDQWQIPDNWQMGEVKSWPRYFYVMIQEEFPLGFKILFHFDLSFHAFGFCFIWLLFIFIYLFIYLFICSVCMLLCSLLMLFCFVCVAEFKGPLCIWYWFSLFSFFCTLEGWRVGK